MRFIESHRVEYKRELSDSLEKEVVAFLNSKEGGVIFLGIDSKNQTVFGIENADDVQLKVKDRIRHNIAPSTMGLFDVILEKMDEKSVIKIHVASGSEKPYHLYRLGMSEKGCFIRIGSASEPMPAKMIEALFSRRTRDSLSQIKSPKKDLTFEQLQIYYSSMNLTLTDQFLANLELINDDGKYNYVAYLLSDKNGTSIKVAKYAGTDRYDLVENNEYGYCSLVKATKQVLDKLEVENRVFAKITPKERLEKRLLD